MSLASQALQASEDIKNFCNKMQPLFSAAQTLEKIGKIDQVARETEERKVQADSEYKKIDDKLKAKKEELLLTQKEIDSARDKAVEILENAEKAGAVKLQTAHDQATQIHIANNKAKNELNDKSTELHKEVASLEVEVVAKKEKLDFLNNEIQSAKNKISALMKV